MEERRQHSRQNTDLQLELFEAHTGLRLGRLVDLSLDGFMLFSDHQQRADSVIECRLAPAASIAGSAAITFAADCLWSRPGADGQHGWAGFHIIDIADDQSIALQRLLASI